MTVESQPTEPVPVQPPAPRLRRARLGRLGRGIILRFAVFAILALVVMVGLLTYAAWQQVQNVHAQQETMASWTANSMDAWLQNLVSELAAATLDPRVLDAPPDEVATYLRSVLIRDPAFSGATLIDVRLAEPREIGTVGYGNISAMPSIDEWLTPTLAQGYFIAPMRFVQGMPMVVATNTFKSGGQIIGIVAIQADMSQTYRILAQARTPNGSYAYIVDAQGRTVIHGYTPFMFSREIHSNIAGVAAALAEQPVPLYYLGLNEYGEQVIGAYEALERTPWVAIAEQPIQPIVSQLLPLFIGAVGVLILGGLAALIVGIFISRQVATPIARLQDGARRIGAGDLEYHIDLRGRNELTDLAEEFNRMTANVRQSQARQEAWSRELEERVEERTTEVRQALEQLQAESLAKERLLLLVKEMSSPVIPIIEGIMVIPIVGALDSERAQKVIDDLLAGVEREKARVVILDITGLAVVDTAVANSLLQAARAGSLLGAQPILVGISPEVAQTLVQLGVDLRDLQTAATLQEGLQMALGIVRRRIVAL